MMKQILTAFLAGVMATTIYVSGAAASENAMKCTAVCDFSKEQIEISGLLGDGNNANEFVTVQILKSGVSFEGLNEKSIDEKEAGILYTGQQKTDADGKFNFTIGYSKEDMPPDTVSTLPHNVRISAKRGSETVNMVIELASKEVYIKSAEKVKTAVSKTDEEFAAILKDELPKLGFDCSPLEKTDLNGSTLKAYRAYLSSNTLDIEKMTENSKIFQNFMLMEAIKKNQNIDLEDYIEKLYWSEDGLEEAYKKVTKNQTVQTYFMQKFAETLKNSDEVKSGANVTLDTFTKAWKATVILTNARYGAGFGDLKSSLAVYGSAIGITQVKSDSVYRSLLGKDYTVQSFKNAFNAAKSEGFSSGGGGGSSSSNGGASKSNQLSGMVFAPDNTKEQDLKPIRKNFIDIDSVEWASEAILALADKGIIDGKEEQVFKPNDIVTREEFIKILVGAMNLKEVNYTNHFIDVNDSDWFCSWVNIAYEKGICQGIGNGYFGVGNSLTRQDMAVLLSNTLKLKGVQLPDKDTVEFEDKSSIADYAIIAVSNMVSIGAVHGVSETEFNPAGEATRAQAAAIIYRVLDKLQ